MNWHAEVLCDHQTVAPAVHVVEQVFEVQLTLYNIITEGRFNPKVGFLLYKSSTLYDI